MVKPEFIGVVHWICTRGSLRLICTYDLLLLYQDRYIHIYSFLYFQKLCPLDFKNVHFESPCLTISNIWSELIKSWSSELHDVSRTAFNLSWHLMCCSTLLSRKSNAWSEIIILYHINSVLLTCLFSSNKLSSNCSVICLIFCPFWEKLWLVGSCM